MHKPAVTSTPTTTSRATETPSGNYRHRQRHDAGDGGCSAKAVTANSIVGGTFEQAVIDLPEDATYIVHDISPEFGQDATYHGTQFGVTTWIVVAACSTDENMLESSGIEFAVTPSSALDAEDQAAVEAGEYEWVVACDFPGQ